MSRSSCCWASNAFVHCSFITVRIFLLPLEEPWHLVHPSYLYNYEGSKFNPEKCWTRSISRDGFASIIRFLSFGPKMSFWRMKLYFYSTFMIKCRKRRFWSRFEIRITWEWIPSNSLMDQKDPRVQVFIYNLENVKLLWTQKSRFWFHKQKTNGLVYFREGQHMSWEEV